MNPDEATLHASINQDVEKIAILSNINQNIEKIASFLSNAEPKKHSVETEDSSSGKDSELLLEVENDGKKETVL